MSFWAENAMARIGGFRPEPRKHELCIVKLFIGLAKIKMHALIDVRKMEVGFI